MRRISLSFLMLAAISTALPAYAQAVVYRNNTRVDRSATQENSKKEESKKTETAAAPETPASPPSSDESTEPETEKDVIPPQR